MKQEFDEGHIDLSDFFRHATTSEIVRFCFIEKQKEELCNILNRKYIHSSDVHRVQELYYDGLGEQEFTRKHEEPEYLATESTKSLIELLDAEFYSVICEKVEKVKYIIPLAFDIEGKQFWKEHALAGTIHFQDCTDRRRLDESYQEAVTITQRTLEAGKI